MDATGFQDDDTLGDKRLSLPRLAQRHLDQVSTWHLQYLSKQNNPYWGNIVLDVSMFILLGS